MLAHSWFAGLDLKELEALRVAPPVHRPDYGLSSDSEHSDDELSPEQAAAFDGF